MRRSDMDVSKLFHILDVITEEELKGLQTEYVTFISLHTYNSVSRCSSQINWHIKNDENEKIGISFFIEFHDINNRFLFFETRISAFEPQTSCYFRGTKMVGFLSKIIEQLQPIVMHVEEKRQEIEQNLQKDKTIRFLKMMDHLSFKTCNYMLDIFKIAKNDKEVIDDGIV